MFDAGEQEEDDDGGSSDEENAEGFFNNDNCIDNDNNNDNNNDPTVDTVQEDSGGVDTNTTNASTSTLSSATDVLDKWKYLRETLNMFVFNNGEPANPADIKTFIPDDYNPSNDTTTAFNSLGANGAVGHR